MSSGWTSARKHLDAPRARPQIVGLRFRSTTPVPAFGAPAMHPRFIRTVPAVFALALLPAAGAAAQNDVVNITRRANPAVITLHAFNSAGRELSLGSGFYLPDGR